MLIILKTFQTAFHLYWIILIRLRLEENKTFWTSFQVRNYITSDRAEAWTEKIIEKIVKSNCRLCNVRTVPREE